MVLRRQVGGKGNWKGPLCVTGNNKALQHELWGASAARALLKQVTASSGGRHAATAALRARAGLGTPPGLRTPPGKHPDRPDALDGSSAFWSIVGTQHLRHLHQKRSACSSPPASSPTAVDGKKLWQIYGNTDTIAVGNRFSHATRFYLFPIPRDSLVICKICHKC